MNREHDKHIKPDIKKTASHTTNTEADPITKDNKFIKLQII